jgi:HK97 family phage prohead protease
MAEMTLAAVARALEPRIDQPGVFSGYASQFGVADNQGDKVERGAFAASLEAWRSRGRRPAMLWQHDASEPIGLWTKLEEDSTGLRVEGRLLLSIRAGVEAYEHLKAGTVDGLSIGYQAVEARRDRRSGIRRLVQVNLWEISLVTFPANQDARVATVKSDEAESGAWRRIDDAMRRIAAARPLHFFRD